MAQAMMQQAEAEASRRAEEHQAKAASAQEEIDALFAPGVLSRLRHRVRHA
jgi:hypothetical protein